MPAERSLIDILKDLTAPRRERQANAYRDLKQWREHREKELLDFAASEKSAPYRGRETIIELLMEGIGPAQAKRFAVLQKAPNARSRAEFARWIAEAGELWTLPYVARSMKDEDRWVRQMAAIGLRNFASDGQPTPEFAKKAGALLIKFIAQTSDDPYGPALEAIEVYAPEAYAKWQAKEEAKDPFLRVTREVFDTVEHTASDKAALKALERYPPAHKYIFATNYVDADLRNGGIDQLYHNSTWSLMPEAIEGAGAFEFPKLADVLREIVYYYHRKGRSKLKTRLKDDYFASIPKKWNRSLDSLENAYYAAFDKAKLEGIEDLWRREFKRHPALFTAAPS